MQQIDLNEDQKLRLWKQFELRYSHFSREKIMFMVQVALTTTEAIAKSALEMSAEITSHYTTDDARFNLGTHLLALLPYAMNTESKRGIIQWIRTLENETILKKLSDDITLEDVNLLLEYFPKNKSLQSALTKRTKASTAE